VSRVIVASIRFRGEVPGVRQPADGTPRAITSKAPSRVRHAHPEAELLVRPWQRLLVGGWSLPVASCGRRPGRCALRLTAGSLVQLSFLRAGCLSSPANGRRARLSWFPIQGAVGGTLMQARDGARGGRSGCLSRSMRILGGATARRSWVAPGEGSTSCRGSARRLSTE
jgi:hypothetical protein